MRCATVLVFFITTGISALKWIRLNSTCYQVDEQKVNYHDAVQVCRKRGVVLHSVKYDWEMVALKPFLKEKTDYWVASAKINGVFKWADGRICCPASWWGRDEPGPSDYCARLYLEHDKILLWGKACYPTYGLICSKSASVFTLVKSNTYDFRELCGVEIIPNCEGNSCEDLCRSHPDCDQFSKMSNMCINIKNASQTNDCILEMRSTMELYRLVLKC